MIYKANDTYEASLRATWTADPADTTMSVTAIPDNLPTIITSNAGSTSEKKFSVTGTSGDSPANYALTGVTLLSGVSENVSKDVSLTCLNHEEFFNQYSEIVNEDYVRLVDQDDDPATPDAGKTLFYLKDGQAYTKDDAGVETVITTDIATQAEVATGTDNAKIVTPLAAAPYGYSSLSRQAIINGNFDVSQRATTFVAGANNDDVYTLDRWNLVSDGNDVLDVSQEAVTDLPGSNYAIKLDVETAKRAGIVQFLEAKDAQKFKGKTVSISFAVKSANISAIRATVLSWASTADSVTSDIVGTWGETPTWATNWADNATPADLTVTSGWTTVKVEGIAIDEATVNNLALAIWLPNEETIGDIVYISQVQMNMGSVALPFQPKSYEEESRACRRYYQKVVTGSTVPVVMGMVWDTAGSLRVSFPLCTPMRPAITLNTGFYLRALRTTAVGAGDILDGAGATPVSVGATYAEGDCMVQVVWGSLNTTLIPAFCNIGVWGNFTFSAEL